MFNILVHACVAADRRDLALKTFRRALAIGVSGNVRLYTSALSACATPSQPADITAALNIYQDMVKYDPSISV